MEPSHKDYLFVLVEIILIEADYSLFLNTDLASYFSLSNKPDPQELLKFQVSLEESSIERHSLKVWWLMHRYFFQYVADQRLFEKRKEDVLLVLTQRGLRLQDFPSLLFSSLTFPTGNLNNTNSKGWPQGRECTIRYSWGGTFPGL